MLPNEPARHLIATMPPLDEAVVRERYGPDAIVRFRGEHGWLSNMEPCSVVVDGREWPSAEHAYQGQKTELDAEKELVRRAKTPKAAKSAGKKVTARAGFFFDAAAKVSDPPVPTDMSRDAMRAVIAAKFERGSPLAVKLLQTGERPLVEGNTWNDRTWGVTTTRKRGCSGSNALGLLLMERRAALKAEEPL